MTDQRSQGAEAYRRWYGTARWKATRARQLKEKPLCAYCIDIGRITVATICDHVERHNGDEQRFWNGPFQSLCKEHHDVTKQRDEATGYSSAVGNDGWPLDPKHPANAPASARRDRGEIIRRSKG
jgi:5-methylcytosine-specific restriction enzyme A